VSGQAPGSSWPSAHPPTARTVLSWELEDIAQLPGVRAELRRVTTAAHERPSDADLRDQLILAFDEMASNALRHGGGAVQAAVRTTDAAYLIEVSDQAETAPPSPAVGRDPSEGGLGLYLIAELASAHGWYARGGRKHVWALLPRH
jgi:anti-sigma regulatory factor (Ser/Thr protein kinase)